MTLKIESGIPMPPDRGDIFEAVLSMAVGNSFTVETDGRRRYCYSVASACNRKVQTEKLDSGEGWRVWRVK